MIDNKNLILAIVLSVTILLGFEYYFKLTNPAPPPEALATTQHKAGNIPAPSQPSATPQPGAVPSAPGAPPLPGALNSLAPNPHENRAGVLAQGKRIPIETPRLHGSISLKGGLIDDLTMADYRETLDPESREIVLLTPKGVHDAYYAQFGWVAKDTNLKVPGTDTVWTARGKKLSPDAPLLLIWDNGQGFQFRRTIAVDGNYMFTITQEVVNKSTAPHTLFSFGLVSRRSTPETTGFYILHEGLLGVFEDTLAEVDYEDLQSDKQIKHTSTGGWIGITDKYWLAALVPDQKTQFSSRFLYSKPDGADTYQVDYVGPALTVQPGGSVKAENRLFAGAKEVRLLDGYEEQFGVARFDLAIDFGWFYFLTKPIFYALLWLNDHILNLGLAILVLTVGIKLMFFPLANKSYTSMSKMKKLQPKMTKIRERFSEDKMQMNQAMMDLYKKEKVNPASGCLPILVQIPVFFALYKVLFVTIEMRHAPFFGWIQDLSAPDPTTMFNLFGLIPFTPPDFLMIGVWPLLMGITMFLQQKLNPQPADPIQAKIFLFLPLFFTFLLARFPAGLVIYWAWNNLLSILQQWVIMRRMGITGKEALQ
ncbi:MAG: membrane protein insertase YidC [Rhodospirillaceae bacterium]|nr:membrane protein insertase YidC [Rhodospirillaceae bacterium]